MMITERNTATPRTRRPRRGYPRYRRYTEDGQPTDAFLATEAAAPRATRALTEYTGIPDELAPSPLGKLIVASLLPGMVRPQVLNAMLRVGMVADAPPGALIQTERNGTGRAFYRLVWRGAPGADGQRPLRRVYLTTDPMLGRWAQEVIQEKRWKAAQNGPRPLPMERIRRLQWLVRCAHNMAKAIAERTGYRFHGYALVEAKS